MIDRRIVLDDNPVGYIVLQNIHIRRNGINRGVIRIRCLQNCEKGRSHRGFISYSIDLSTATPKGHVELNSDARVVDGVRLQRMDIGVLERIICGYECCSGERSQGIVH